MEKNLKDNPELGNIKLDNQINKWLDINKKLKNNPKFGKKELEKERKMFKKYSVEDKKLKLIISYTPWQQ